MIIFFSVLFMVFIVLIFWATKPTGDRRKPKSIHYFDPTYFDPTPKEDDPAKDGFIIVGKMIIPRRYFIKD